MYIYKDIAVVLPYLADQFIKSFIINRRPLVYFQVHREDIQHIHNVLRKSSVTSLKITALCPAGSLRNILNRSSFPVLLEPRTKSWYTNVDNEWSMQSVIYNEKTLISMQSTEINLTLNVYMSRANNYYN